MEDLMKFINPETFAYVLSVYLLVRFEKVLYELKSSIDTLTANCRVTDQSLK